MLLELVTICDWFNIDSRSQNATLKQGQNIKYLPYAFTQEGVAMLSSVLRGKSPVLAVLRQVESGQQKVESSH